MKALILRKKQVISYESVPFPILLQPTDVIVQVKLCAICGSDLHIYHEKEKDFDYGMVMGHEFTGIVVDKGSEVKRFAIGDKVISPFSVSCGACFYCQKQLSARCIKSQLFGWTHNGQGLQGGQAEYVRVPLADATLVKTPEGISDIEAVLLGDILPTGYFCADIAQITHDGVYVVLGCGPVGLMAIYSAKELGAEKIYAVDAIPNRLAHAEKLGATALNFHKQDIVSIITDMTEGRGADAILEIVGTSAALKLAHQLVRPGGIIAVAGVHTENNFPFTPTEAYNKNLTYKTGRCSARFYIEKLVPLVQKNKLPFSSIISHILPLQEGTNGYQLFDRKLDNCIKVVLTP